MSLPPIFDDGFQDKLGELLAWRRDVRRFRREPVPEELLAKLLDLMQLSPSVGYSQPWRWLRVDDPGQRAAVQASFSRCNAQALADYEGERAALYARLKLEGLREAPLQFAVFCDRGTAQGHGLGRQTMPEMLDYSVVAAITQFWLAARAHGLGLGWVSILDPAEIADIVGAPSEWKLIGYLCLGYPEEEHEVPELVRAGWESDPRLAGRS
ncbi:5,6-dimethylbenzimidazole synthase [Bosea vestrisii]|uniref:5,6-dimethylbenzimidazole synthase n=1 Tax=Bosea vestrisii TaxID=151416 RepID=UPI0024E03B67|nr:5,6-dimethylbenzimidazole synthase [Bosea vestrisii]WID94776.1 5,6-dimethylbenzimidazole synthase [Bosea vestrisii]